MPSFSILPPVLPEIFGLNRWVRGVAERMSAAGVPVLAMPLSARTAPALELGYEPPIKQMKLPIAQLGSVFCGHQHGVTHKRFGSGPVVHAFQAHHIEAFSWQLPAFEQLYFFRLCSLGLQPARARFGEAFGKITGRIQA